MNTECGKPFDPNCYRCKTCGTFALCHKNQIQQQLQDDLERERQERCCPQCGAKMEYDPGDGCVHEPEWYCDAPGCHFNDRGMATAMMVVAIKMREEGKTLDEIKKAIDDMKEG